MNRIKFYHIKKSNTEIKNIVKTYPKNLTQPILVKKS